MAQASISKGVYAITDETLLSPHDLGNRVEDALRAGISVLQYRSKQLDWNERVLQASTLNALCNTYRVPLLINDDVDLCLEVGAAGVHLGQADTRLQEARDRLGANAIVGITCHSDLSLAKRAQEAGASYVAFGRFFPSSTKPNAPSATIEVLHEASAQLEIPIVAIGGVNAENGAALIEAGAGLLAVIHYLFAFPDTFDRAQRLTALFK